MIEDKGLHAAVNGVSSNACPQFCIYGGTKVGN